MDERWDAVKTPPTEALKKITGGRLIGMTDIKPQWRYSAMTETYGLCGIGWKYEIVKKEIYDGSDGQKVAVVDINLYIKSEGEWSNAIPGTGGSMLIAKEKSGPYTSDECFKMAMTDALSVAMAKIGVASDIYMGLWDGSKYSTTPKKEDKQPINTAEDAVKLVTKLDFEKKLWAEMGDMTPGGKKKFYAWLQTKYTGGTEIENLQLMIKDIEVLKKEWLGLPDVPDFEEG